MRHALASVVAIGLLALPGHAAQDATRESLTRTIAETTALAERVVPQEQRQGALARLARAKAAADAGRLHLALYELEGAFVLANAHAFATEKAAVKTDEEFAATWKSTREPSAQRSGSADSPSLMTAMATSAARRAPTTYRAALPYGQDAGVAAGLYYLGEAQALASFADFARGLHWRRQGSAAPIRSIQPELDAFDAEVTKAYESMTTAEHSTYIVVSVLLKRAKTLSNNGDHAGALFEYLLARLRFSPLRKTGEIAADDAAINSARSRLSAGVDHSIARVFVEMAETALASDDAAQRRNAGVIVGEVLPAYHAALTSGSRETTDVAAPAVTITLVRWPFT
jgi:hypothetical protein